MLGHWYFAYILDGDAVSAGALGGKRCQAIMTTDAERDVAQFHHVVTRGVTYTIDGGGGSDDTVEFITIQFTYQPRGKSIWQRGSIRLMSTGDFWNIRSLCGNILYRTS
jgi:hypothetical protein